MRILYVATDQVVPGTTGGSVHVLEVATGLARRGHDVHAVVRATAGEGVERADGVVWHRVRWWPPHRFFRRRAGPRVRAIADAVTPDVVMERYYNFGGEGVDAAFARGIPSLLEVNSPVIDHPRSVKAALDAALLVRPMRRWRERMVQRAAALVSPLLEIVPEWARSKTEIVTWGANVEAFHPERRAEETRRALGLGAGTTGILFSGSFRPWHGVHVLEEAARRLHGREDIAFVLVGDSDAGEGRGYRGRRLGAVPYARMPDLVAAADVGVAPYDTARLSQLGLGFYWSPLKIFEYMASGLPTVTIPRPPLGTIVRHEQEGLLVREGDPGALAAALARLADDATLRARLGRAARERVVARFSWAAHCEKLEEVMERARGRTAVTPADEGEAPRANGAAAR